MVNWVYMVENMNSEHKIVTLLNAWEDWEKLLLEETAGSFCAENWFRGEAAPRLLLPTNSQSFLVLQDEWAWWKFLFLGKNRRWGNVVRGVLLEEWFCCAVKEVFELFEEVSPLIWNIYLLPRTMTPLTSELLIRCFKVLHRVFNF